MDRKARVLAIDFGASSGRGIVFELDGNKLTQSVVHRFSNGAVERDGKLYWDLKMLYSEVLNAVRIANADCGKLDGVGIDTWGVDIGYVGWNKEVMLDEFRHYRNPDNAAVSASLSNDMKQKLFGISGISDNDFNTTYQLIARRRQGFDFRKVSEILFTPQLLGYMLTGVAATEPTVASTCGFYDRTYGFDLEFLNMVGIPAGVFPKSVATCSVLGNLKSDIAKQVGIDYELPIIATAGHDTACAVMGIPSKEEYPLFLSSGTWSLFGALNDKPIKSADAWKMGYTNELAFDGKVRFLRNIMGMWIIQECRRQWLSEGKEVDYPQIVELARQSKDKGAFIDVNDKEFALPCNMADKVKQYVLKNQGIALETVGDIARCVYFSLAKAYKEAYDSLIALTGKRYDRLYIIGGGANNGYLNQIIADTLQLDVSAGPAEASALGNALGQFIGLKALDKANLKDVILSNYDVKIFLPK